MELATLEKEALSLDVKARGHLVGVLLRSLDEIDADANEAEIEKLWLAEVQRRDREMDADPSIAIPYDEMMSDLRSRYR